MIDNATSDQIKHEFAADSANAYWPDEYQDSIEDQAIEYVYASINGTFTDSQKRQIVQIICNFRPMPTGPRPSQYRESAIKLMNILREIDEIMITTRNPHAAWAEVSLALGLKSTREKTMAQIAKKYGFTTANISKKVTQLLRNAGLPPAMGRTNGRRK